MHPDREDPTTGGVTHASLSRRLALAGLIGAGTTLATARSADAAGVRGIIDASAHGVLADGHTDDAPALMRAVAAMSDAFVLQLPPGIIALGSLGWAGVLVRGLNHIRIQGDATILKWLAKPSQSTSGFGPTGLRLLECKHSTVADIKIDGNGVDCIGLGLETCTSCAVERIEAYAHGVAKISRAGQFASSKGMDNRWYACLARDATPGSEVRGFYLGNANSGWGDADLKIEGCVARQNTATGFAIEANRMACVNCVSENNGGAGFTSSTAPGSPSADHIFQGNVARQNAFHGWQTDVYGPNAERIALTGNILSNNGFSGAYCNKGTGISMVGNLMAGNGSDTASPAIAIIMSNGVTMSNNIIEGDAVHGVCVGFNFAPNKVNDVIIANNVCRGTSSKTIWIEALDGSSLQRIVVTGNLLSGGSHGIYVGTAAAGAVVDGVTIANNIVEQASASGYCVADQSYGQSTNVRMVSNSGTSPGFGPHVRLAEDRGNSWNAHHSEGDAVPTEGAWRRGDIIFNSAPLPGSPMGWICTRSGTPGTWGQLASIAT